MDETRFEAVSACTLNRAFGYKPQVSRRIIDELGSAGAVFKLSRSDLKDLFGPYNDDAQAISDSALEYSDKELDSLAARGLRFIGICDPVYPSQLRDCPDAPAGLYVRSESPLEEVFSDAPMISIVGTRDISLYGKEWCTRIVGAISQAPIRPVIVSGMAIGVDITAHMAALGYGLPTIGVLPTGIDNVYPRRHWTAAEKIVRTPGSALVTDFPPDTSPQKATFLRRNRIIAGLGRSTILIESKAKGGGMITARLAFDYGREVFALPGRIDDIRSAGCNALIGEKVAESITSLSSMSTALGLGSFRPGQADDLAEMVRRAFPGEDVGNLVRTADAIRKERGITTEGLCAVLGCSYHEAASWAGLLESAGLISMDLLQRCSIVVRKV